MTAGILTAMPICTMFALLAVAPGYLQGMAADPDGRNLIVGAIVAQVIGNLCIRKIIRIKV
jgi:Flp pilus assembly protein TadB